MSKSPGESVIFLEYLDSDLDCVFDDELSGAEEIEIVASGSGESVAVPAMFEAPGVNSQPSGLSAAVVSQAPMLHIPEKHLKAALARPLSTRDVLVIRGRRYRPQNPQSDGFGLLSCKLLRSDNA